MTLQTKKYLGSSALFLLFFTTTFAGTQQALAEEALTPEQTRKMEESMKTFGKIGDMLKQAEAADAMREKKAQAEKDANEKFWSSLPKDGEKRMLMINEKLKKDTEEMKKLAEKLKKDLESNQ
jgi:cytochrome c556